jgi:chromosomal replication initiation ATPase DnaA
MITHAQKSRLMSLLRDPDNKDLLDEVMGMDTIRPEQEKTPRQRVNALAKFRNTKQVELAKRKLKEIIATAREPQHEPDTVLDVVQQVTGITREELTRLNRKRHVVDTRHLTIGLMSAHCLHYSMTAIAGIMHRNHATGLHCAKMFETLTETDPIFRAKREKCEALLREKKD